MLSFNMAIIWGDICVNILNDKEMSIHQNKMMNFLLRLSNIMSSLYPEFNEDQMLIQVQLVHVHVRDLSDLEDMNEWGTTGALRT